MTRATSDRSRDDAPASIATEAVEPRRSRWSADRHEHGVERFYGTGVERFQDYHGGYLNFGWWEEATDYLAAAEALVHRMGALLGLDDGSRLLDVACGMAPQDVYLHRRFGARIDALDVTWPHVEVARARVAREHLEGRIRVHHGTATALPFGEERFTHLMSIEGAEHFDTREDFFHEARRVLAPGGVLALADYALKRPPRGPWERFVLRAAQRLWHVPDANVYDGAEYVEKLRAAGFRDVSVEEVGRFTIPGYVREQRRAETLREVKRVRGWWTAYGGLVIDAFMHRAFQTGLIEYVLVRAVRG